MATFHLPLDNPYIGMPRNKSARRAYARTLDNVKNEPVEGSAPSVLVIAAYFLILASIAVVAIGGQFPWFTIAPVTILLLYSHFRRVEAKLPRKT